MKTTHTVIRGKHCFFFPKPFKWILLLAFILFFHSVTKAQIYPYRNYSVRDGLVNSFVFTIAQDSSGFIWFGTENGLSRFDGLEFKNYTLAYLGVKSYISSLYCVSKDKLIFGTGNDGIYSFDLINDEVTLLNKDNVSQSSEISIGDTLMISLHEQHNLDMISLVSGHSNQKDEMISSEPENKAFSMLKTSSNIIYIGRKNGLYQFNGKQQIWIQGFDQPVYSISEMSNGDLLIGTDGAIYLFNGTVFSRIKSILEPQDFRIRNIIADKKGNTWFNKWGSHDIYMMSNRNKVNVSEIAGIKNTSVTKMFCDRDGNIWVGTIGKGIYLFTNMNMYIYPSSPSLPNANIMKIVKAPGGLLLGTNDGVVYLDSITGNMHHAQASGVPRFVKDIRQVSKWEYVVAIIDKSFDFRTSFTIPQTEVKIRYCQGSSLYSDNDQLLIGNWDNCFFTTTLSNPTFTSTCDLFPGNFNKVRVNDMFKDNNGHLWVGSDKGILLIDKSGNKHYPGSLDKNEKVISVVNYGNNKIAVVTSSGFVVYENNMQPGLIKEVKRVFIPLTTCITFISHEEFIAGTLNGIIYQRKNQQKSLSVSNGILSENINCIYYSQSDREAWIGTAEGLINVNLDLLMQSDKEKLKVHHMVIIRDNLVQPAGENISEFPFSKNSVILQARAFNYQNPKDIKYQYRHNNGSWLSAPSGELNFASLEPGNHTVHVRASLDEKHWGPATNVSMFIIPPFYRTWWFYTLAIISTTALIIFVSWKMLKSRRIKQDEKMQTKQKLVELQQKALASNLNPHFVFNSLNSIQHFINNNSIADANDYLAKFSRLMRMHLNMADMSYISMHEEISRLEYYLSLEQMRFGEKLKWFISVDEKLNYFNLEIPNMIIQPFVENSIWHGIMPLKGQGVVRIDIRLAGNDHVEIAICDNGVGYGLGNKQNGVPHESKGIKLISERLLLLDQHAKNFLFFTDNQPGTTVHLMLTPAMYKRRTA